MKIKFYSGLFFLCFGFLSNTHLLEARNVAPSAVALSDDACTLPPPASLNVVTVGTTWADLSWPAVPGADHYHIVTKDAVSGIIVDDGTSPSNTTGYRTTHLTPGGNYIAKVYSVCQNGDQSITGTPSGTIHALIIDYVISGYSNSNENGNWNAICPVGLEQNFGCEYAWTNNTYFNITAPTIMGQELKFLTNVFTNITFIRPNTTDGEFAQQITDGRFSFENVADQYVKIYFGSSLIAKLTVARPTASGSPGILFRKDPADNNLAYTINKILLEGNLSGNGSDRNESNDLNSVLTVSPNPFTNLLNIEIPYATEEEDVKINLYDLRGRLVIAQQTHGGPPIRSLPTEDLAPGLYLLRVDTGDRSETIKVMKAQ